MLGDVSEAAAEAERALDAADDAFGRMDVEAVVAHLSAAVRGFTAAGEPCRAALACARLGDAFANALGNRTAARAWFTRAARLVEDLPPCIEQGWVAIAAMGCEVDDPAELLASAELALDRARRFGDLNLETKALADAGLAHVQSGRVAAGMALLDEAMALACGPADDQKAASQSVCSFFTACYFAADFERAGTWADVLRQHGLIGPDGMGPAYLSGHCDSVQATLLMELGRWSEAETLLERAVHEFETVVGIPSWHPAIALADLRVRQGRFAEAEVLLLGKDQSMQALLPAARLHLARGNHDLAVAAATRGLRAIGPDQLRAVELLTLLVDAHLAAGAVDAAHAACDDLQQRLAGLDVPPLQARSQAARARFLVATGDPAAAVRTLDDALAELDARPLPWLRATLLLEHARVLSATGEARGATALAAEAATVLRGLDVVLSPADTELLERLTRTVDAPSTTVTAALVRDGSWWSASCAGTTARLRDSKGLRYLAELIALPGREQHALDLVDRIEGTGAADDPDRHRLGDAGALLDGQARLAYRRRIEALRAEAEDAIAEDRLDQAEALEAELDLLVAQLALAFGLGGQARVAGSVAERARLNVTRALRAALAKLAEALPEAGATLDRRVRTGLYCAYEPVDGEIRWIVQSGVNGNDRS